MDIDKSEERKNELRAELETLTEAVNNAIKKRDDFLDEYMHIFVGFEIGDELCNCRTGEIVKCVSFHRTSTNKYDFEKVRFHVECSNGKQLRVYGGQSDPYIPRSDYENKTEVYLAKLEQLISKG